MTARALWYADGLRWIGTLFHEVADHLSAPSLQPGPGEPVRVPEDYVSDIRFRLQDRF